MTRFTLCSTVVAALLFAAPPTAMAKRDAPAPAKRPQTKPKPPLTGKTAPARAIADCTADGDLDKVYSPGALLRALRTLPSDVAQYTDCDDVLKFARATGPTVPVTKRKKARARVRVLCTGTAYDVTLSVGDTKLGTATVPACARGKKAVNVPVGVTGVKKARRHSLATVVANPGGKKIQYVVRLKGIKL